MTKPQLLRYSTVLNEHRNALATQLNKLQTCPELQFTILVKSSPKGLDCTYANKLHTWHLQEPHKELQLLRDLISQAQATLTTLENLKAENE